MSEASASHPMWRYEQGTGKLFTPGGVLACIGYSGHDNGKNCPFLQNVKRVGPIPRGFYEIGEPHDSDTHGPYCLRLTPFPENEMFDRDGFLMHGDSKANPGPASEGCIIMPPLIRHTVWDSGIHLLEVTR